jgi:hypothetical protein
MSEPDAISLRKRVNSLKHQRSNGTHGTEYNLAGKLKRRHGRTSVVILSGTKKMEKKAILLLVLGALFLALVSGLTYIPVADPHLLEADVVLIGHSLGEIPYVGKGTKTLFKFQVEEIMKGQDVLFNLPSQYYSLDQVTVAVHGGYNKEENYTLVVPGAPEFHTEGERVLLFLILHKGWLEVSHFHQGAFHEVLTHREKRFAFNGATNSLESDGQLFARDFEKFGQWIRNTLKGKKSVVDYLIPFDQKLADVYYYKRFTSLGNPPSRYTKTL